MQVVSLISEDNIRTYSPVIVNKEGKWDHVSRRPVFKSAYDKYMKYNGGNNYPSEGGFFIGYTVYASCTHRCEADCPKCLGGTCAAKMRVDSLLPEEKRKTFPKGAGTIPVLVEERKAIRQALCSVSDFCESLFTYLCSYYLTHKGSAVMTIPHCHPPDEDENFVIVESPHNIEGRGVQLRMPQEMKDYLIIHGYKKTVGFFS
jgi:hypothetical protein